MVEFLYRLYERGVSPEALDRIMSAVKFIFKRGTHEGKSWLDDESIRLARSAVKKQVSARDKSIAKELRKRAPVDMSMIKKARDMFWSKLSEEAGVLDSAMTYMGMVLAFHFMWRVSEYIMDEKCKEHAVLTADVIFVVEADQLLSRSALRSELIRAEQTRRSGVHVARILFVVRSSKTSGNGISRYLSLGRTSPLEVQLIEDIVQWVRWSGEVHLDQPFLSRWGLSKGGYRPKKLTRRMVSDGLKVVADALGYRSIGFAPQSLRRGGASTMIAKGQRV